MTKNLKWRLGKMATPDEVLKLVNDKIITKEEARTILFNEESEETRDEESLKQEIKFLREIVEKLSKNRSEIVETIRIVEKPYYQYHWVQPYLGWQNGTIALCSNNTTGITGTQTVNCAFTDISTF